MSTRTLTERWRAGTPPVVSDREPSAIVGYLREKLGNLERILGILHGEAEYMRVEIPVRVDASATTAITATTNTDITGATVTFTPDVDSRALVTAQFMYGCSAFASVGHFFVGSLHVNGVEQAGTVQGSATAASFRNTLTGTWVVPLTAGTEYTIKLRAKTGDVATTYNAIASGTTCFTYLLVPNLYRVP